MKSQLLSAALVLCAVLHGAGVVHAAPAFTVDLAGQGASPDVRYAAGWVAGQADNQQMPFAIVDKKNARMFVFEASGRLRGASAVLLGAGPGDDSVPGIAGREPASLLLHERTTPAGRFISEPGRNLSGEDVVWVDYGAKIAIHRLRPGASRQHRAARLASGTSADKQVTLGCIVVPVAFYERVVSPAFGQRPGVVYVLPEAAPVHSLFRALDAG